MKKIICPVIAALMILGILCACDAESKGETAEQDCYTIVLEPDVEGYGKYSVTDEDLDASEAVIEKRLESAGVVGYEVDADDNSKQITVSFPKDNGDDFDPAALVEELIVPGRLSFRNPNGEEVMDGSCVKSAAPRVNTDPVEYYVLIEFNSFGKDKFAEITEEYSGQQIAVYLDDTLLASPTVQAQITDGTAQIYGDFTAEEATGLADLINGGVLPFCLKVAESNL